MGNDNCCASRKKETSLIDKKDKDCIRTLFYSISENSQITKGKNVLEKSDFAEYLFEGQSIQEMICDQLFGENKFVSLETFTSFAIDLVSEQISQDYITNLAESVWLKNRKQSKQNDMKGGTWFEEEPSKVIAMQLIQEIYQILEMTDSSKKNYNFPDAQIILSTLSGNFKSWKEILSFFKDKYPLLNNILDSYFKFKFLSRPMQYGFPTISQKSTMAFCDNICAAISLTSSTLLTKITSFQRLFSSGELTFDFDAFSSSLDYPYLASKKKGGVLIILKFLCKDAPGTHHQQVIGCLLSKKDSSKNSSQIEEVKISSEKLSMTNKLPSSKISPQKFQDFILFEIEPHFKPIYQFEETLNSPIEISEKGVGIGKNSSSGKYRIWIDKNMFTDSYVLSNDDIFEPGFESFESNILIHVETWGFSQEKARHTQQHIEASDSNYRQFIQHKNYMQIFSNDNDSSKYTLSYQFQSITPSSHPPMSLILSKQGSLYNKLIQNDNQIPQLTTGSLQISEEEKNKRALQLIGENQSNSPKIAGRATIGVCSERLQNIQKKYKDISSKVDRSQVDCQAILEYSRSLRESSAKKQKLNEVKDSQIELKVDQLLINKNENRE